MNDASLQQFVENAAEGLVVLVQQADDGSPVGRSKVLLGAHRFAEVAEESLKRHLVRLVLDEDGHWSAALQLVGRAAADDLVADLYASVFDDIIEAAGIGRAPEGRPVDCGVEEGAGDNG